MAGASAGALLGLDVFNSHIFAPVLTMGAGAVVGGVMAVLVGGAPKLPPVRPELRPITRRRRAIPLRQVPAVRVSPAARRPGAGVMTIPAHPSRVSAEHVDAIGHVLSERVRRASRTAHRKSPSPSPSGSEPVARPAPARAGDNRPAAPRVRPALGAIDVNAAGVEELSRLPGVGPAAAGRIVAHREANGPFGSVQDLAKVERFTIDRVARLAPRAAVSTRPAPLRALPDADPYGRACPVCGGEVISPRATYCSPSCRQAAYRERQREQRTPAGV